MRARSPVIGVTIWTGLCIIVSACAQMCLVLTKLNAIKGLGALDMLAAINTSTPCSRIPSASSIKGDWFSSLHTKLAFSKSVCAVFETPKNVFINENHLEVAALFCH